VVIVIRPRLADEQRERENFAATAGAGNEMTIFLLHDC